MILFVTVIFVVSTCTALPSEGIDTHNVITVPPNCPVGQVWVNGACRDVWRSVTSAPANVVSVPPNCPPGQEYVNGQCRDVWFRIPSASERNILGEAFHNIDAVPKNMITVPTNCPPGQQWVNGQCRDVWRSSIDSKNVITVPTNCPPGQEYVNGQCRDVWRSSPNAMDAFFSDLRNILLRKERQAENPRDRNIISVPSQCPAGFRPDALGVCRPILP